MERLINYFKPDNYKLQLNIDKHKGTARGRVTITGEPKGDVIKLHAKNLTIDRILLDGNEVKWEVDRGENEIVIFATRVDYPCRHRGNRTTTRLASLRTVATNNDFVFILIDYHFTLNTNMMGCYLSSYQLNGKEEKLVSTQFESHYARECFPCVDEPGAKATFDLEITVPDLDDTVIANTPALNVVENTTPSESKTITFETTPRMSTYLLAFCIGKFQSKSTKSKHGVEVTTYCALNHDLKSVDFANEIATAALDYYDDNFGIAYPLKKLDQIAIPDFEAGAMENWGLVTYRESCLLSGDSATIDDREYVATVIAHELSHQWFGNLVTMEWWNNLWLNESFATMMEYLCVDAIHPEYNILEDFFIGECRSALNRDALPGVQAVQQDVNDPAEIATLFDSAIVYAKGAHLMFMLYRLMGERSFFAGLKEYFKAHKYANTTGDDLWNALQPHAKFDVKGFMDAWISRPGYPVVTDGDQMRFLLTADYEEQNWNLPGKGEREGAKPKPITDETWPLPEVTDDMSGHYLLNLSAEEFQAKLDGFNQLNFEQKARLLIDRSLLAKTQIVSTALHLELLPCFREETDESLWGLIAGLIGDLKLFFPVSDPDFDRFKQYILYIVKPQFDRLGVEHIKNESENDVKLRSTILGLALFTENAGIEAKLAEIYDQTLAKIASKGAKTPSQAAEAQRAVLAQLDPETRYAVLYAKMRRDEADFFPVIYENYQKIAEPDLKNELLNILTTAREHNVELLKLLKEPKIVRPQDHLYLFIYLLRNYRTRSATINWLYENWGYVEEMNGEKSIEDYPRILAGAIRTAEKAATFDKFFSQHADNPVLKRTLKVAKAEIEARLRLISTDDKAVHTTLKRLKF
ncbi:M1 family metallopeptidase [Candidatus Saccharibacteria bacterium]|nr:M1 family metallopeptidase [Candidatus Saccharibacteria bacterium]